MQARPVISDVAVEVGMVTLFFSRVSSATASATDEAARLSVISTPSRSYHWRAMFNATSGRFWWSATTVSTLKPRWPNSCTASRAQATVVGPLMSRKVPDISVKMPILMVLAACAFALRHGRPPRAAAPPAAVRTERLSIVMVFPFFSLLAFRSLRRALHTPGAG